MNTEVEELLAIEELSNGSTASKITPWDYSAFSPSSSKKRKPGRILSDNTIKAPPIHIY